VQISKNALEEPNVDQTVDLDLLDLGSQSKIKYETGSQPNLLEIGSQPTTDVLDLQLKTHQILDLPQTN